MHKQGVEVTTNGHTHLQFARFSLCQYIEWPIPTPCGKGLILMPTCYELLPFRQKP
jgi:hypothetical protein